MHKTITRAVLMALLLCTALVLRHSPAQAQDLVQDSVQGSVQDSVQAQADPVADENPSPESLSDVEAWIRTNLGQDQAAGNQCDGDCPPAAPEAGMEGREDNATALDLVSGQAEVDFGDRLVRAVGTADLPAQSINPARDKALAQRTAAVEARKHLLQALLGLPLDGSRTVAQALAGQSEILAELRGLAQNSRLTTTVDEPGLGRDGTSTVLAELDLAGPVAERLVPMAEAFQTGLPFKLDLPPDAAHVAAEPLADAAYRQSLAELGGYTGVVVDARGLGAVPALLPRVMDRNGLGVYGPFLASRSVAVNQGMAVYVLERSDPRLAERVGADPLWVRALGAAGEPACDLVVSVDDGALVRKVFEKQELRESGALVILLD